jgi:hypothetical protein
MGGQGLAHCLMGGDGGLFARPAGGAGDQPLLDGEEVGGGPAALFQGPVGDHADRPLGQEPVRQLLEFGAGGTGQAGAEGEQDVGSGEGGRGRGQPVRAGQPTADRTRPRTASGPDRGRVSGRSPPGPGCPGPPRARPRPDASVHTGCPGVSCSLGFLVAWTAHLTSRGVRSPPSAPSRSSSASIWPVRLENRAPGLQARPGARGCRGCPPVSAPPRATGPASAGRWPGRWRRRPADAGTGPVRPRPSQRPSGPWTRLAMTRWVCNKGSPSRDVRWSKPTASTPRPYTCWTPPWPRRAPRCSSR